jgi:hypothetical protein
MSKQCCVCGKFIAENTRGMWLDSALNGDCDNITGLHQPDPTMIRVASQTAIVIGDSLVLPKGTAMFVVAVDSGAALTSISGLIDRRNTPMIVAGMRELADQWETEYNNRVRAAMN